MKIIKLFKRVLLGLYKTLRRFPETIMFSTATVVIAIVMQHNEDYFSEATVEILRRIIMVTALGIPLSLCIKLFLEGSRGLKKLVKILIYIIPALGLVLYYVFLTKNFNMVSAVIYFAVSMSLYLSVLFIPYLVKKENFELHVIKLFMRLIVTGVYSLIMFGGFSAIIFTIQQLFTLDISSKIYLDIWLIIVGVFAPCFFLAEMPTHEKEYVIEDYPKFLKVLLLYIVMPLITAYSIILYAYFAKILITQQWPEGLIGNLVLWYTIISIIVVFFISPFNKTNKWSNKFIFWFPKLAIPLLIMMFIAIGIRISAFGITESRYYVVLIGLWALGILIYYNIAKKSRNIVIPITLAIIAILSVFGPWSSFSVSKHSQNNRLEIILNNNNMIQNNILVKTNMKKSDDDMLEISEILRYFENNHNLSDVKYLPDQFNLNDMVKVFGFSLQDSYYNGPKQDFINYYLNDISKPVEIEGYQYFFNFSDYRFNEIQEYNDIYINYNRTSTELIINYKGEEIYKKTMSEFVEDIYIKYVNVSDQIITIDDATKVDENEKVRLKFIIMNVFGNKDISADEIIINELSFTMFLEIK